ncbi:Leucine rich repeat containing 42 [Chamberlinius hualienensis]
MSSPSRLLDIVLQFIAKNVENLESLNGFPELLGELIFKALVTHCQTSNQDIGPHLKVFSDAYQNVVLKSLNLSRKLVTLNEHFENLQLTLIYLTALDLSHCHLGSKHDILDCIAEMTELKILHLNDCAVDDEAIRRITIPCRVYKKGIITLQELDLSNNTKLTSKCLSHLQCLKKLIHLRLPTGASLNKNIILSHMGKHDLYEENPSSFPLSAIKTEGWALPVIAKWVKCLPVVVQVKFHSFYGFKRKLNYIIPGEQEESSNFICLVSKYHQRNTKPLIKPTAKKFKSDEQDIIAQYAMNK